MISDFNQLRCFITVAEELHFGRAAARLFMTQPPLSRQIRLLEEELGVRLFERSSKSVRLTAAGENFLVSARSLTAQWLYAGQQARLVHEGSAGTATLGYTAVTGYKRLPDILATIKQHLPGLTLMLKEMISSQQILALNDGTLSVALIRPLVIAQQDILSVPLYREPVILALHRDHPLAGCESVTPEQLHRQSFISYSQDEGKYFYDLLQDILGDISPAPEITYQMNQTHSILSMVNAGAGIAIVPESATNLGFSQVVFRPLWPGVRQAEIRLAWREGKLTPAEDSLKELIIKSATQQL